MRNEKELLSRNSSFSLPCSLAHFSSNTGILHIRIFPGTCIRVAELRRLLLSFRADTLTTRSRLSIKRRVARQTKPAIIYREHILFPYHLWTQNRIILAPRNTSISLTLSLSMATYIACPIAL